VKGRSNICFNLTSKHSHAEKGRNHMNPQAGPSSSWNSNRDPKNYVPSNSDRHYNAKNNIITIFIIYIITYPKNYIYRPCTPEDVTKTLYFLTNIYNDAECCSSVLETVFMEPACLLCVAVAPPATPLQLDVRLLLKLFVNLQLFLETYFSNLNSLKRFCFILICISVPFLFTHVIVFVAILYPYRFCN
jgi:hypothetical protein